MPRAMTRVYLPDGRYKTIVVESDQTVRDLLSTVVEKFQVTSTENFSNYVLFESLDNEKVLNELPLTAKPYDITTQWKPDSTNRLIFKSRNQSVLVHDTGFVPAPSTTVLPDAPKNNPPPSTSAPQGGQPPIPTRKLPTGAQPLFTPGATTVTTNSTIRKRSPSDATQGPTQSYQPVNTPSGNAAELQERLNKMKAVEQERRNQDTVQKQSIVVWCNYHLKSSGAEIADIVTDFADGVNFALLIQALTKQTIKINQNPRTYQEKMENLRGSFIVLESIGAKPKGCTPEDFVNGNANAITGLMLLLVGRFKDVSKRASSRFSTILTSQGAAVSSAPSRPPPQRPPRPPGTQTLNRPTSPTPISTPSNPPPTQTTSAPSRPQPAQPPTPTKTTAPVPVRPVPTPAPKTTTPPATSAPPQQPPAQPSKPTRPQPPPRSSLDPEATNTHTKQSTPTPVKPSTMRERSTSAADTTSTPAPAPTPSKTTTAPSKTPAATPTTPATTPASASTAKSPFTQPLPDRGRSASSADVNPTPVKRPAPAPTKPKQTTQPQPPPQPAPAPVPAKQLQPEEDEFALGELDKMMDTIHRTSSFVGTSPPAPAPTPAATSSKTPIASTSSTSTSSTTSKYPALTDDDLGEITVLAESLSEITTEPASGNLPIRKLSSATIPTTQSTPAPMVPTTTAPVKSASVEEESHFEDFDELEDFLADLANELGVQLGEMEKEKPKNNNDLSSLDLDFGI